MDYLRSISNLKEKSKYEKEDLLIPEFELYHHNEMYIYYAPHNEYINKDAQLIIVGITPGWTQMEIAYRTAKQNLIVGRGVEEVYRECKFEARFAGSMRANLIMMLDALGIGNYMGVDFCEKLFQKDCTLLHTTSLIKYPVFVKGKNYSGGNPKILENEILFSYVQKYFVEEIQKMTKEFMILPLGKAVEEVLGYYVGNGLILERQCLFGFPHPSGANAHRYIQFEKNKENLQVKISNYFRR